MPSFSQESTTKLITCEKRLMRLCNEAVKHYDFTIISGHRSQAEQLTLINKGLSKTKDSKHLLFPSLAVDLAPYPIDWADLKRFYYLAGFIKGIASQMNCQLRWGGDWDSDNNLNDQTFNDLCHFELVI